MSENLNIDILGVNSVWEGELLCKVSLNNSFLKSISFSAEKDYSVLLPGSGDLSLEVEETSTGVTRGYVSVSISLLPREEMITLPLFPIEVFLTSIPPEVAEPSIEITLNNPSNNSFESHSSQNAISEFPYRSQLDIERQRREAQESKTMALAHEFKVSLDHAHKREMNLLQHLENTEKKNNELILQMQKINNEKRRLEHENQYLNDMISKLDIEAKGNYFNELKEELLLANDTISELEDKCTKLKAEREQEVADLKLEFEKTKDLAKTETDKALKKHFKDAKLFQWVSGNEYKINGVIVSVFLIDSKIFLKKGLIVKYIDEFFNSNEHWLHTDCSKEIQRETLRTFDNSTMCENRNKTKRFKRENHSSQSRLMNNTISTLRKVQNATIRTGTTKSTEKRRPFK